MRDSAPTTSETFGEESGTWAETKETRPAKSGNEIVPYGAPGIQRHTRERRKRADERR